MKTIWKFSLERVDVQSVKMPNGAAILCVQMQNDIPCLWAEVEDSATVTERTFQIIGTGNPISPIDRKYIGTFQDGPFVWHLFEI